METISLKSAPELKRLISKVLPSYKKHNVFLSVFGSGLTINSYWDGGSKSYYTVVDLATLQTKPLPSSTHPYFDVARHGIVGESPDVEISDRGNITLKRLPENFAVIESGVFCGKTATAHVYVNAANLQPMLKA